MTTRDLDRVMIQIQQWWSRSRDDPDPREIQIELWSRSSYDDSERSISSDDPDPTVMIQIERWSISSPMMLIQIEWWSRSSDAILWWSRSRDDLDPDDLKTKMTQRRRWSSWCREEDQCWKLCRKNTFLVKRECWCICNFRMYSSMYSMYCIMYLSHVVMPQCFDRED